MAIRVPKKINVKTDLHFYIFTQLNDLLSWGITPSDIKILSELYNVNFEMVASGNVKAYKDRMSILFSTETKKEIMSNLSMSYNTFNNSLSKLRRKGLINEDNTLIEKRMFDLNKESFIFTIELMDEEKYSEFIKKSQEKVQG